MLDALLEALLEMFVYLTGHGILWVVTFGRWDLSSGSDSLAGIVGVAFWYLTGALVIGLFL